MPVILMTDLDGTLLGHDDFDFAPIKPALLDYLADGMTLLPNSSKTRPEMQAFCEAFGARLPFIYENGAALANGDLLAASHPAADSCHPAALDIAALEARWTGQIAAGLRQHCVFVKDMDRPRQQAVLGLQGAALERAMGRAYSLPFLFEGHDRARTELTRQARAAGLSIQQGGRVCNLSGQHGKADFNSMIKDSLGSRVGGPLIAFGDSQNDTAMLEAADIACILPRPGEGPLQLANPPARVITAEQPAPLGWLEAAQAALNPCD